MNYKKWIIDAIESYREKKVSVPFTIERISMLEREATSIRATNYDAIRTSGTPAETAEDRMLANLAERQALERNLRENEEFIRMFENAMAQLTKDERVVIECIVAQPKERCISAIMERINVEKSQAYRVKSMALRSMAAILFGRAEE